MITQILQFLKKTDGYFSGEEISRRFRITRSAACKHIQELRHEGYEIIAVPHLGYRYVSAPDKLIPHEIQSHLGTNIFGRKIVCLDTLPSTMDEAFRLGLDGAVEGTVVCAEGQLKGRGRLGRGWTSPKGKGIYFSVILKPLLPPNEVASLTLLSAVALSEAIKESSGISALIKWPNDLLVNHKKLAGILIEMKGDLDRVRFVVIGIGLNVNTPLNLLPPQATSLKHELNKTFSRSEILKEILRSLERWYEIFKKKGFEPIHRRWKEYSCTLGERVRIADGQGVVEGMAIDIDDDGGLLIRRDTGLIVKRLTGDIVRII